MIKKGQEHKLEIKQMRTKVEISMNERKTLKS